MFALILAFAFADPPKITISKETTYITGPLRADGMVDYLAYVNAPLKEIKPEDNAAVLLAKAIGPSIVSKKISAEFFQLLRTESPSGDGTFLSRLEATPGFPKGDEQGEIYHHLFRCEREPWKAAEHPVLAEWLRRNEEPLKLVIEASKRKRFVEPVVAESDPPELDVSTKFGSGIRLASELLAVRAMEKLGRGRTEKAIADLDAVYLLDSLLVDARGTLITGMTICALRNRGLRAEAAVVSFGTLTAQQSRERAERIRQMATATKMLDPTNELERLTSLSLVWSAMAEGRAKLFEMTTKKPKKHPPAAVDEALYTINAWTDRIGAAFKLSQPDRASRLKELVREKIPSRDKRPAAASGRRYVNELIRMQSEFLPVIDQMRNRAASLQREVVLAYLCRAYKLEHRGYPERLDASSLGLAEQELIDPLTDKAFLYVMEKGKAKIMSPGPNGEFEPPGKLPNDDFVIELP